MKNKKTTSGWMSYLWCAGRVREPTAAGGRCREADEVKTTSRQGCALSCRSMRRLFFRAEPDGFESHRKYMYINKKRHPVGCRLYGALEGTRTPDPLIRSQVLYPAELPAQIAILY